MTYLDQSRRSLDPEKTVWEEISDGHGIHRPGRAQAQFARLCERLQLHGDRPAEKSGRAFRRRAQPGAPGKNAQSRAMSSCWMSRPTTWMSIPCARWKKPWKILPAAPLWFRMTAGSWTGSPRISWLLKATAGLVAAATGQITKPTGKTPGHRRRYPTPDQVPQPDTIGIVLLVISNWKIIGSLL